MPRKALPLPPVSELEKIFYCDFDAGVIRNRISRTSRKVGERADDNFRLAGYRTVYAFGRHLSAHRVIWAMATGEDTNLLIDHINGDTTDNRLSNLRVASNSQNKQNSKMYANNTSGVKGVAFRKDNGKWRAFISVDGKRRGLGQFDSCDDAAIAVQAARRELHGKFARAA